MPPNFADALNRPLRPGFRCDLIPTPMAGPHWELSVAAAPEPGQRRHQRGYGEGAPAGLHELAQRIVTGMVLDHGDVHMGLFA